MRNQQKQIENSMPLFFFLFLFTILKWTLFLWQIKVKKSFLYYSFFMKKKRWEIEADLSKINAHGKGGQSSHDTNMVSSHLLPKFIAFSVCFLTKISTFLISHCPFFPILSNHTIIPSHLSIIHRNIYYTMFVRFNWNPTWILQGRQTIKFLLFFFKFIFSFFVARIIYCLVISCIVCR